MIKLIQRYSHNVLAGVEAIFANKVKSLLTALGIIFGVAAVIAMLAIGNGAQKEILEQIKLVGVNNIVIKPTDISVDENANETSEEGGEKIGGEKFSRKLTLKDAESIEKVIPTVSKLTPVISFNYSAVLDGKSKPIVLEGVNNNFFDLFNIKLQGGRLFNQSQIESSESVCIIGSNIKNVFFGQDDPIGKYIKCGNVWLKIIGFIEPRDFTASASDEMGISSTDNKIFVPVQTVIMRFKDRSFIRPEEIGQKENGNNKSKNYNQLDKIIVQVDETENLSATSDIIKRMILRRHNGLYDFEVTIPELLLKQEQKTKEIFNIVLGVIASISLIVGGIGIMNIMLASVMERIREIGLRQAVGASKKDIIIQFLSESTIISISGGIIGIILGIILSKIITVAFDIRTIITPFSIIISFGVSVLIGITFGYLPSKRASDQDPVDSLRN